MSVIDTTLYTPQVLDTPAFVQGFSPLTFTTTTMTVSAGAARAITNEWVLEYPGNIPNVPGFLTVSISTLGVGGCYPVLPTAPASGKLAMYPLYIVGNSSGTTGGSLNANVVPGLVIATADQGFIPYPNDVAQCIGFVLLNDAGQLVPYSINGPYNNRQVMLQDAMPILVAGAVVGPTVVPITFGVSTGGNLLAKYVSSVNLLYAFTPNAAADIATLIPTGLTSASVAPVEIKTNGTAAVRGNVIMPVGTTTVGGVTGVAAVSYGLTSTSDSLSLWLSGFAFNPPIVLS